MIWTEFDSQTIALCRDVIRDCAHYHVQPAPHFELCLQMHAALEQAGMLEDKPLARDLCADCEHELNGACRRAYRGAFLDEGRTRVIQCTGHVQKKSEPHPKPASHSAVRS